MDVGLGDRTAITDITSWRMIVRKRPVNQVEVEVIQLQVLERLRARHEHFTLAVLIILEFGVNPEIMRLQTTLYHCPPGLDDQSFVAINRSAIEVMRDDLGRGPERRLKRDRGGLALRPLRPSRESDRERLRWSDRVRRHQPTLDFDRLGPGQSLHFHRAQIRP